MHKNALLLTRSIEGFEMSYISLISALGDKGWRFYLLPETLERFKRCSGCPAHHIHSVADFVAPDRREWDQLPPEIRLSLRTHRGNFSDIEELKSKNIVLLDMVVVVLTGYGGIRFPSEGNILIDPHALLKAATYAGKVAISRIDEFAPVARFIAEPHLMTRNDWYVIGGIPGIRSFEGELPLPARPAGRPEQTSFFRRCLECPTPRTGCSACSDPFGPEPLNKADVRMDGEVSDVVLARPRS